MRKTVTCGDGRTRTGTVIYIGETFETLEFKGRGGNWHESFYRPVPTDRLACRVDGKSPYVRKRVHRAPHQFTAEDLRILRSDMPIKQMAVKLGCNKTTVSEWRSLIGAPPHNGRWRRK